MWSLGEGSITARGPLSGPQGMETHAHVWTCVKNIFKMCTACGAGHLRSSVQTIGLPDIFNVTTTFLCDIFWRWSSGTLRFHGEVVTYTAFEKLRMFPLITSLGIGKTNIFAQPNSSKIVTVSDVRSYFAINNTSDHTRRQLLLTRPEKRLRATPRIENKPSTELEQRIGIVNDYTQEVDLNLHN